MSEKLRNAAIDFMSGSTERRDIMEMLFVELVKSGAAAASIVFEYLNGLPFPMTLHLLEPPTPLDQQGFCFDHCPGLQIGYGIPPRPFAGELTVFMVESMLSFLLCQGLHKELYVAVISADGRGAAFRSLGSDDVRAWPILITHEPSTCPGAA